MYLTSIVLMQPITVERAKELFDSVCTQQTTNDSEWTWKEGINYEYTVDITTEDVLSSKLYELCSAIMFYVGGPCDIWYTPEKNRTRGIVGIVNRGYYYNIGA